MPSVSFSQRLIDLAAADPGRPALTVGFDRLTRAELVAAVDERAAAYATAGVAQGDMVTIALPNSLDWFVSVAAAWRVGAIPQPISARLPERERAAIIELAQSVLVVDADTILEPGDVAALPPAADTVSPAWKAPTSGGSTGRPKLIVSGDPGRYELDLPTRLLLQPDGCLVMPGPLYHNGPIVWACTALLQGSHVVCLPRFDAEATLAAMADHRADVVYLVPTMMKRIWRLPEDVRLGYDLSALRIVWHLAEPCPDWLKQVWIDWLGPERIWELYAGTEAQTATVISGVDWLAHRGSVGKPAEGTVMVTDADGNAVPTGKMGEVWLRNLRDTPTYRYVGATARTREGGWESLGDMGYLDADGFLYLGDRSQDMILTGGSNVYPAEVEAAIAEHPAVRSVAVIGLPDEDKGNVVHAIVEADPETVPEDELLAFLRERLVTYKLPRTIEYVDEALRDDAGKVRRAALRESRLPG